VPSSSSQAVDTFGRLDVLINNAGILRDRMLVNMTEDEWDAVIKVHLKGTFAPARHAAAYWRDQAKIKGGPVDARIITTTSVSGIYGNIGQTNYAAAKMGVVGLSRTLAQEGARSNVRSNVLALVAWTRLTATVPAASPDAEKMREELAKRIRPDQPARFAVALTAPAAAEVTGQIFAAQGEDIALFSQPRPVASASKPSGWSVETILSEALPKLSARFHGLETSVQAQSIRVD